MSIESRTCAVCGQSVEGGVFTCPKCGYQFTTPVYFNSDEVFQIWKNQIGLYQAKLRLLKAFQFRRHSLMLFPTQFCICHADQKATTVYSAHNAPRTLEGVVKCSVNSRHTAYLRADGTVYAEGSNATGQCDLKDLQNVRDVYAGANCTYVVDGQGNVIVRGESPVDETVRGWKRVKKIVGNKGRVVALTEEGTLLIADDIKPIHVDARDVVDFDTTYNYTVWLCKDGTVGCECKVNDPRNAVKDWKDIVMVGVENYYVVGLKKDGTVVCAGKTVPGIDMDRSKIAQWKDVVAIACSNSGILGIMADGSVEIVGNVENRHKIRDQFLQDLEQYW
jgi:alpha-tubulin suppressor-like RCC1 family protein